MSYKNSNREGVLSNFLTEYDPAHNLSFHNVKFRPGATRTTPFGIDITTTQYTPLRIHNAIDSARSWRTGYDIYVPFDLERTEYIPEYGSFGALLILYTKFGFSLRLAHMAPEDFAEGVLQKVQENNPLPTRSLIGQCGELGLSFGRHLHLEIVSESDDYTILNDILQQKFGIVESQKNYTEEEIITYFETAGLEEEKGWGLYEAEKKKRGVSILNPLLCYRYDYHTKENRFFYSSMALFGM